MKSETKNEQNEKFYFSHNTFIPKFTNDLKLQAKIEQCIINSYCDGYKVARRQFKSHIYHLKQANKNKSQKIKELEKSINER